MASLDNKKSAFNTKRRISFLFLIILLNVCVGCPSVDIHPDTSNAIGTISEKKSLVEGNVCQIKNYFSKDTEQYKKANKLYIEAKAAFDGWIDQFKFDLTANTNIATSDRYKESLNKASEKGDVFLKYADSIIFKETKSKAVITAVTSILPSLTDAGIKIWEQYRIAAKEKREEIKKDLDNLKWKNF